MNNKNKPSFATQAIHHGYKAQDHQGALNPPVHFTSTYTFESAEQGGDIFAGEQDGHFYSRISNPTLTVLEDRIACLEGAEAGLATASGIGAITSVLWTLLKAGDEIIVDKTLYGCTYAFLHKGLAKFGVRITHVDMTNLDELAQAISNTTRVIYFETPANPNMRIVDIEGVSQLAKANKISTVVDNTYATPFITRPIEFGADIVVHSATKYLGGHGDLIAGLVVGKKDVIQQIRLEGVKDMTGACMSPFTAMLILRGLKTLELRMKQHSQAAMEVAEYLLSLPQVTAVMYPGLKNFAQYELAKKQMALFGGMIAFELKGGINAGKLLINGLSLIQCAVSLGDAESLIQHPASMTHSTYTEQERAAHGISDDLIRLSVGLESVDDIIADLTESFNAL
ncbi:methionine gamma-lyase [Glaciecola sp. 2405UD65-10]|jgi:methionine-gamma-lyase|uniref:methionine gamma-lyase n=1 Tax=Glaciecola sp. 2405UD65-10 TaxID=3397244 RepID=UPI003B5B53E1